MAIAKSSGQNNTFQGESDAAPLVRALNDELPAPAKGKREVIDRRALLVLVKRLQRLAERTKDPLKSNDSDLVPLNRFLERYVATPLVLPNYFADPHGSDPQFQLFWSRTGNHKMPFTELRLVLRAIELTISRQIQALRQCAVCGRWLFARFEHQKFCGSKCKETSHRADPARKEARRKWARDNYWLHKNKNVK